MLTYRKSATESVTFYKYKLVVTTGPNVGREYIVESDLVRVGANPDNDIVIPDGTVSRHHLEILVEEDGHVVRDLGSTNGTDISGCRIKEAYLYPGAQIGLGDVVLQFRPLKELVEVKLSTENNFGKMLGHSTKMRALFHLAERVAARDTTVLITGETGTGKGLLAEEIHNRSSRCHGPFVVVDCSTIPEKLIEVELFGHVKGAFTGAISSRIGSFEEANGGTIFLDEIGELPRNLQPKLLRILERQEIKRVGETSSIPIDVRIIAATNRNLRSDVDTNNFREDLFFRISVFELKIPPLRERNDDIPFLAKEFINTFSPKVERVLGDDAIHFFQGHDWPGNVRELRNVIERIINLVDERLIDVPAMMSTSLTNVGPGPDNKAAQQSGRLSFQEAKEIAERRYLLSLLKQHDNNISAAAKTAGIQRQSLHRLIRKHAIKNND
jgi:transcriptional regulator with PAS, ATPase and Fis domain